MQQVERAIFDLRRGMPVLVLDGETALLVQAVEGPLAPAIMSLAEATGQAPALVLSRHRLGVLGDDASHWPAARLTLPPGLEGRRLASLAFGADPEASLGRTALAALLEGLQPACRAERGALALMRRSLLVPAALVASVAASHLPAIRRRIEAGEWLAVPARDAEACLDGVGGMLQRVSEARIPLEEAAVSRFILFREPDGLREHVAVVIGEPDPRLPVPLRLHSACLTGDLFGSLRCDCGDQLRNAVADIESLGGGVLLYLAQEGRGIGLANKLRAYTLQDAGLDTLDADQVLGFGEDERRYGVAVDMLAALGIRRVQLLTNNPHKLSALAEGGIEVVGRQGLYGTLNDHNRRYLSAKAERAGHFLDEVFEGPARP